MGDILGASLVTFIGALLMLNYMPSQGMRRLVGQYRLYADLCLHGTIIFLFLGTSTMGLLQAEAAGIGISLYLRWYARFKGLERREKRDGRMRWVRYESSIGLPAR